MSAALDVICPMHLCLDATGVIRHAGPTLAKLRNTDLVGRSFWAVFDIARPRALETVADMRVLAGRRLHLRFRDPPRTRLKAVAAADPSGDGILIDLSFGMSILEGVRDYALTSSDFAPTDLAIEMLYLVEAKSAAMEASRKLNLRLQGAMIRAEEQAYTDTLTGLKNRRALDHILDQFIAFGQSFALLHIDLDHFKEVNDNLGHAAGDHVLREVALIMADETREDDVVARVGGDEFIVLLPGQLDEGKVAEVAGRLIARFERPIPFKGTFCRISASIGIALSNRYDRLDAEGILEDADTALYASKSDGRARYTFHAREPSAIGARILPGAGAAGTG